MTASRLIQLLKQYEGYEVVIAKSGSPDKFVGLPDAARDTVSFGYRVDGDVVEDPGLSVGRAQKVVVIWPRE